VEQIRASGSNVELFLHVSANIGISVLWKEWFLAFAWSVSVVCLRATI